MSTKLRDRKNRSERRPINMAEVRELMFYPYTKRGLPRAWIRKVDTYRCSDERGSLLSSGKFGEPSRSNEGRKTEEGTISENFIETEFSDDTTIHITDVQPPTWLTEFQSEQEDGFWTSVELGYVDKAADAVEPVHATNSSHSAFSNETKFSDNTTIHITDVQPPTWLTEFQSEKEDGFWTSVELGYVEKAADAVKPVHATNSSHSAFSNKEPSSWQNPFDEEEDAFWESVQLDNISPVNSTDSTHSAFSNKEPSTWQNPFDEEEDAFWESVQLDKISQV